MNSNSSYIELVDSQAKSSVTNCSLFGKNQLIYDNLTKSFLINLTSTSILIPKAPNSLNISKSFLILLIYIQEKPFTFEFVFQDSEKFQKRIILDNSKSIQTQFSYSKFPNREIIKNSWVYLSINLSSIYKFSFGDGFEVLTSISIHGTMLIRKIISSEIDFSDLNEVLCDMGKIRVKEQVFLKKILTSSSGSPKKKESKARAKKTLKPLERLSGYFDNLSEEKLEKKPRSPHLSYNRNDFSFQSKNLSLNTSNLEKKMRERATPTYLLLDKPSKPGFFQHLSSGLLNIRHETPPFVGSNNLFYNPVQKKYDSLQ